MLNRRAFLGRFVGLIGLLSGRCVGAQNRGRARRVGYLVASTDSDFPILHDALRRGLRELGYVDGQNIEIIVRSANGSAELFPALVIDLIKQDVDVIFAANTPAAMAAKTGAPATPLVFAGVGDPVGMDIVKSLPRPGGNATGIALLTPELTPKRLTLLKEAAPKMTLVAVLSNPGIKGHAQELRELEDICRSLGIGVQALAVRRVEDFESAFASMKRERADGLVVLASPLHHRNIQAIAALALDHRLPAICEFSEFGDAGGLMVYGPSWPEMYRHAATYVAKILEGAAPADLPVEQPTKIELLVNLRTSRALGVTMPQSLLIRADRIIH